MLNKGHTHTNDANKHPIKKTRRTDCRTPKGTERNLLRERRLAGWGSSPRILSGSVREQAGCPVSRGKWPIRARKSNGVPEKCSFRPVNRNSDQPRTRRRMHSLINNATVGSSHTHTHAHQQPSIAHNCAALGMQEKLTRKCVSPPLR
jgi:hypothetical protein